MNHNLEKGGFAMKRKRFSVGQIVAPFLIYFFDVLLSAGTPGSLTAIPAAPVFGLPDEGLPPFKLLLLDSLAVLHAFCCAAVA